MISHTKLYMVLKKHDEDFRKLVLDKADAVNRACEKLIGAPLRRLSGTGDQEEWARHDEKCKPSKRPRAGHEVPFDGEYK